MNKTPKPRAVLAAAAMILAGLGYLVAQYVALMADPNPRGTLSASQAVLLPASALAIMVGLGLLVVAATHEFGRRPQILLGITVALAELRPRPGSRDVALQWAAADARYRRSGRPARPQPHGRRGHPGGRTPRPSDPSPDRSPSHPARGD